MNSLFMSFFLGGLSQILLWTFAKTYAVTLAFAVVYGLLGGWYVSLTPVVCAQLFGIEGLGTITGWMVLMTAPGEWASLSLWKMARGWGLGDGGLWVRARGWGMGAWRLRAGG